MLEPGLYYHIFNHANGSENLFRTDENYYFFLKKYAEHINPIAETYAYCLMPNHFHLLVRIKEEDALKNFAKTKTSKVSKNLGGLATQQFSNLFNSYTKSYNKVFNRKGSLFIPNFKKSISIQTITLQK